MKRLLSARALPAIVLSVAMCVRAQTQTNDAASAAEPLWWSGIWAAGRVNADNDAPINVGQLKHVASRALAWLETEFETRRITEAEEPAAYAALGVFSGLVAGWTPGPAADNAAPVPVGALKETAAKFHDVLAALGYPLVTGETVGDVMETEEGLTNPPRYPWGAAGTLEELQAPANVGQLKTAFRAPHPGLVKGSVDLHPRLTLADDGLAVAGPETLAAQTLPVWGAPRMGAVAYAANGSSLVPNVPTLPSAVRLARPTELRFSPWLDPVWFQGVVHFTAVEHRIGEVTTWIPVVSSGVLAENVLLPYSPGLSADFKRGTYVEFAQVATVRDRPAAGGSAAITIRSAYPLVRRGTLAADSRLRYSVTVEGECTFAGGSEVRFHQFPRLIERAWLDRAVSIEQFEAVGMVAQGTLSATMAAQPVQASPGVTLNLAPGTVADFAGFLTRHLVASGSPPPADVPTDLMTSGSGTDLPEHAGALPDNAGPNPYVTLTESAGARVFFRALLEPRPGDLRPVTRIYQDTNSSYWYRESEQAVGWLARGITAAEVDLPAGVLGVGKVKCAAQHPVTFRHFLHEVTAPPPGTPVDAHTIDEYIHGYLASAVTGGLATVSMPAKRVREAGEPAGAGPELVMIPVPPLHRVAFEYDAMSLSIGSAPWWLPVVRGLLIPGSVSPVASNPQAADADGDGFTAGEEMRMGSSDGDAAVPGGVRPFLASALAGLGPHVIHDERDATRPVGNGAWGHQTVVSIPVTAEASKRYLSLVVTHRGFPRGTRGAVGDTLTWSLTGAGASLGGMVKASDLHHVWLSSMARGRTLGGARPFWVIPLGFVADGEATAGVTVTTASARGEWVVAAVLTDDSQALAGVGGRFVAAGAGVPENHVRINDRPAAIPFAERPQMFGSSTASGSAAGFDSDEDFSPDLEEQAAGTDPQDKHSAPVVLSSLVITRETTRFRPNPYGGNGGWSELTINHGWEAAAGFPVLKRTWVLPPGYVNPLGWKFELPERTFNGDTAEHGDDLAGRWNLHAAPVASRGLPSAELDGDAPVALFMGDSASSAVGGFQREHIFTRGMRYRLRGPARPESQERTYIRARWVKTWPTVEAYYRDLMEIGTTLFDSEKTPSGAPTSTSIVTLKIPASQLVGDSEHYSNFHDVVPQLPSISENTKCVELVTERLRPIEVKVVNRDNPAKTWTTGPVTSGPLAYTSPTISEVSDVKNGDLISWSVPGLTGGSFQWWATGPSGSRKDAPSSVTGNEWKLEDPLDWLPGKWRIHCRYTPSGGAATEIDYDQNLGYRSPDITVIGWIDGAQIILPAGTDIPHQNWWGVTPVPLVNVSTLMGDLSHRLIFLGGLSTGVDYPSPLLPDDARKYVNAWLIKDTPNDAPPASFLVGWNGYPERYMVDEGRLADFSNDLKKFRSFHRFQARFELDDSGRIKGSPHLITSETNVGVTPTDWLGSFPPDPRGETGPHDREINTTGVAIQFNPKNGKTHSAKLRDDFEQYTQGRIAWEGAVLSKRLNSLDVPWIWSIIEFSAAHAKAGTTAVPEHEIFPVYHVYYNGKRLDSLTNTISEAKMEDFIQLGAPIAP